MGTYQALKDETAGVVSTIHAAQQRLGEMTEQLRVLESEKEILRTSSLVKETKCQRSSDEHKASKKLRESARMELNAVRLRHGQASDQLRHVGLDNQKLLDAIDAVERSHVRLRADYEQAVRERSENGQKLIDRQQELCEVYDRLNVMVGVMRNGEVELKAREEDIRFLRLDVGKLAREVDLAKRAVPAKATVEEDLFATQEELLDTQKRVAELEAKSESPGNATRFKRLDGCDPTEEDLQQKVERLSSRLAAKEEQALEKELVLLEIEKLVDRSASQIRAGQGDTVQLAKTVNSFQVKIKDGNRKLMALVSELSMYQARALQLQQQAHEQGMELEEALARLDAGQPPTQDVGNRFLRWCCDRFLGPPAREGPTKPAHLRLCAAPLLLLVQALEQQKRDEQRMMQKRRRAAQDALGQEASPLDLGDGTVPCPRRSPAAAIVDGEPH